MSRDEPSAQKAHPPSPAYLDRPVEHWVAGLRDPEPLERRLAAYALGEIGPAARDAGLELARLLDDEATFVRVWAAASLARIDASDARAAATLIEALGDEAAFVRSLAAWFLGRLSPSRAVAESAGPAIARRLDDEDPSVRMEAGLALRRLEGGKGPKSAS